MMKAWWWSGGAALVLAACGGGGGGDSTPNVSIALDASGNGSFDEVLMVDNGGNRLQFEGHATGDRSALTGRTLYLRMSGAPAAIFAPTPVIDLLEPDGHFLAHVDGIDVRASGIWDGTVSIDVCFDVACKQPLRGSPLQRHFHVQAVQGLEVPTTVGNIKFETRFGTALPPQDFAITLPDRMTDWSYRFGTNNSSDGIQLLAGVDAAHKVLRIKLPFASPSVIGNLIEVTANATMPDGTPVTYNNTISWTYYIDPNPDVGLWVAEKVEFAALYHSPYYTSVPSYDFAANTGVEWSRTGTEYLAAPPAAAGMPLASAWYLSAAYEAQACDTDGLGHMTDCLPDGDYRARDHFHWTRAADGASGDVAMDVLMHVTAP